MASLHLDTVDGGTVIASADTKGGRVVLTYHPSGCYKVARVVAGTVCKVHTHRTLTAAHEDFRSRVWSES